MSDTFDKAPPTPSISPCFIASDVETSISFYVDKLGFSIEYAEPPEGPFFAIVRRDGAMIFLKAERGIELVPNNRRHRHLRWMRTSARPTQTPYMRTSRGEVPRSASPFPILMTGSAVSR